MNSDKDLSVLVTGGSGYIASWIVKYLLESGYRVNTTVRNLGNLPKKSHLIKISDDYPGRLHIHEADLMMKNSFEKAMEGCQIVIHTASPFKVQGLKDPRHELVEPAVKGTENILMTANTIPGIKKIVLTSSVAAVYGNGAEINEIPSGKFTEKEWNVTSKINYLPYSYSKTMAERKAWEIAGQQNQWVLAVINPGFVFGPSLSSRTDGTSVDFTLSMADGRFKWGLPDLYFGTVDVREVARAHIATAFNPSGHGRFILVAKVYSVLEISGILMSIYGNKYPFPKFKVPKWLFYLFGPFSGMSWKNIRYNVDIPIRFDNKRSIDILNVQYRPLAETLKDQVDQLIRDGLLSS